MVIIDSNVIIDCVKDRENEKTIILRKLLNDNVEIGINSLIFFEVYLGNKTEKEKNKIDKLLEKFIRFDISTKNIVNAIDIYNECQKNGNTVSPMDTIIASNIIANDFELLTRDKHFYIISQLTSLKIYI